MPRKLLIVIDIDDEDIAWVEERTGRPATESAIKFARSVVELYDYIQPELVEAIWVEE